MDCKSRLRMLSLVLAMCFGAYGGSAGANEKSLHKYSTFRTSFNCSRANGRVDRMICDDGDLSRDDSRQAFLYAKLLRHSPIARHAAIRASQREWLKGRDACVDKKCVENAYYAREDWTFAQLDRYQRLLRRNVSQVGQCEVTRIEWIGPRLDGSDRPDSTGTSVSFANGVDQVSYEFERPVAHSKLGDRARVCLVKIPKHCPLGDGRGRLYSVTNLRTGEHWQMIDSEHMCGGA